MSTCQRRRAGSTYQQATLIDDVPAAWNSITSKSFLDGMTRAAFEHTCRGSACPSTVGGTY